MKKIVSITCIIIICCLSFSGCGSSNKFIVTFEDGTQKTMSVNKIISLETTDERTFETIKSVSGRGKIVDKTYILDLHEYKHYDDHELDLELDNNCYLEVCISADQIKEMEGGTLLIESDGYDQLSPATLDYINKSFNDFYNGDTISFNNGTIDYVDYGHLRIECSINDITNLK